MIRIIQISQKFVVKIWKTMQGLVLDLLNFMQTESETYCMFRNGRILKSIAIIVLIYSRTEYRQQFAIVLQFSMVAIMNH